MIRAIRRDASYLLAAAFVAAFVIVTAWFGRPVAGTWNSPDETANAFWSARVAAGAPLVLRDAMVGLGAGAIHPRSMAVSGDALVPGSFPGLMLLYGALGFFFRLPFSLWTPLFTAAAGVLFGVMIGRLFDRRTGLWAGALLFLHPAVLYYGARGLFHNELFVDLLILAAACFSLRPLHRRFGRDTGIDDALGGFLFAWAIVTRASEAVWAVPAFALFLPFAGPDRWKRLGMALLGAVLPTFIFLAVNASLYGSPWRTAYVLPPVTAAAVSAPSTGTVVPPASVVLPFGFHPRAVVANVWHYGVALFWWQSLLAAAGFCWCLWRWRALDRRQKTYALAAFGLAAWLAVFYGSWSVRDRLDFHAVTIGTSYVRYFLPAYVAALPFAALAFSRLSEKAKPASIPVFAIAAALSIRLAVFAGDESLLAVRATLAGNAVKKATLLAEIPPDAVVMTERFDKLIVPERLRIIAGSDESAFAAAADAAHFVPVYWYGLAPSEAEAARLRAETAAHGLGLREMPAPAISEAFYRLAPL